MLTNTVSSFCGALKMNRYCSSKIAVFTFILLGVEEYYYSYFYKSIKKILDTSGKEYECPGKGKVDFAWIFHDSGLYAAAVHKSDWFLSIIIFDCMEKKAYEYQKIFTQLKPDHFYWFKGDIVLVYIYQNSFIQLIRIQLDHEHRKGDCEQTRNYDFPYFITETGDCLKPFMKKTRNQPLVECIETAVINNEEYILLISLAGCTVIMIPKDPSSILKMRHSLYLHPRNSKIRVNSVYFQLLPQISHQQFLYYPKMCESAWVNKLEHKYILDGFIELNLEEQRCVQGKEINESRLLIQKNHSGKKVLFNHVGSVPKNISQPRIVITAKRFGNGRVLAVVEDDNTKMRYSCLIDAKKKQITWRKWQPKIQRKSNMILSSLHPSGYFIEIDYKKKQEDDKYKLFSKIVAHPNEPIKLKYMCLVNLFTSESPIEPKFDNYIRRFM